MVESYSIPDRQKLSILLATILLALVVARFVELPGMPVSFDVANILVSFELNINSFIAVIIAGLTASGTDWLLRDHPRIGSQVPVKHWVLPGLTAWVVSFPLSLLPGNSLWWLGFFSAGIVLLLVISAEYIVVDIEDIRHPLASMGLIALSFMLYLIFVISLRTVGIRLLFFFPAIVFSSSLVALRVINLRLHGRWLFPQTAAITLIVSQVAAAYHYLPISPISFGLILFGLLYSLVNFLVSLNQAALVKNAIAESAFILVILWFLAFLIR